MNITKLILFVTIFVMPLFGIGRLYGQELLTGGPYVQNPNLLANPPVPDPTKVNLVWFPNMSPSPTPATASCFIEYRLPGNDDDNAWSTVLCQNNVNIQSPASWNIDCPSNLATRFELTLSGLTAGTFYEYRIWGNTYMARGMGLQDILERGKAVYVVTGAGGNWLYPECCSTPLDSNCTDTDGNPVRAETPLCNPGGVPGGRRIFYGCSTMPNGFCGDVNFTLVDISTSGGTSRLTLRQITGGNKQLVDPPITFSRRFP